MIRYRGLGFLLFTDWSKIYENKGLKTSSTYSQQLVRLSPTRCIFWWNKREHVPGAMDEWGAKTPVAQIEALGFAFSNGCRYLYRRRKKSSDSIGSQAGDYQISKICGEYRWDTFTFFFFWNEHLLNKPQIFLVRRQIGSLFFEDQLSCKRPFEPPEAARETWLWGSDDVFICWSLHNMAFCTTQLLRSMVFKRWCSILFRFARFFWRNLGTLCLPLGQADSRWISGESRSSEVGLASWHLKTCKSLLSRWCRQGCSQNWWFRLKLHNAHNARSNINGNLGMWNPHGRVGQLPKYILGISAGWATEAILPK